MDTQIHFRKPAAAAFYSLTEDEQKKSNELIGLVAVDMKNPALTGNLRQLATLGENIYSLKLNSYLRMIFEKTKTNIEVLDILNAGLTKVYYNQPEK